MLERKIARLGIALAAGLAVAGILGLLGVSASLDRFLYDLVLQARSPSPGLSRQGEPNRPGSDKVKLILIDQYSLSWVEKNLGLGWPWPREVYGVMATFLSGAKAQVFDILFAEVSGFGPGDDAKAAQAFDAAGNVVLARAREMRTGQVLSPLPVAKSSFGSVKANLDPDGLLRAYIPLRNDPEEPSLGLAALAKGGETPRGFYPGKRVFLDFSGPSPTLSARNAAEILAAALSLEPGNSKTARPTVEEYAGSYVFIGFSAPGLMDRQAVPTDAAMPGAEIHATFVANYLTGSLPSEASSYVGALFILICAAAAAIVATMWSKAAVLAAGTVGAAILPFIISLAARGSGWVLMAGGGTVAALAAASAGIVLSYAFEGRQRAFLRKSFAQYLSHDVIESLVGNPSRLSLGGQERTITVLFTDIQGFTTLSEKLEPERLAAFMNRYLAIITEAILAEGGTIDKYVGDSVMAFWNAPLDQPDHALRAVRAALGCQESIKKNSSVFGGMEIPVPMTRIGIHTGRAIVGNMGSPSRFNYTALGDVVNTASRLEQANKALGTKILLSGSTMEDCGPIGGRNLEFRKLGLLELSGKSKVVEVWEPGRTGDEFSATLPWEGVRSNE
jgi:adenylate cyclase